VNLVGCDFTLVEQEDLTTKIGGQYLVEYTLRLPLKEGIYSLRTQITSHIAHGGRRDGYICGCNRGCGCFSDRTVGKGKNLVEDPSIPDNKDK
jgi:hypothetical protein